MGSTDVESASRGENRSVLHSRRGQAPPAGLEPAHPVPETENQHALTRMFSVLASFVSLMCHRF